MNPNLSYGEVEHDSVVYKTIEINGLTWYAENVTSKEILTEEYPQKNDLKYGWYTYIADEHCPPDWHIPSVAEFQSLTGELRAGEWLIGEVSNESGFTLLPAGTNERGTYHYELQGEMATYYTSDFREEWDARRGNHLVYQCVTFDSTGKMTDGFCAEWAQYYNVRCVKNPEGFDYYAVSITPAKNDFTCDESNAGKKMYESVGMFKYVCRQDGKSGEWNWEEITEEVPDDNESEDSVVDGSL